MKYYFCGSMTLDHSKAEFYNEIIENIEKNYGEVLNKFVGEKEVVSKEADYVYKRDTKNLENTDVLIADISIASIGVGFELGYFSKMNKPILLIYDNKYPLPSALARGLPNAKVESYATTKEAIEKVNIFLENTK